MPIKSVGVFESELIVSVVQAPSYVAVRSASRIEINLPEGFQLVNYTLRSTSDGHIRSYEPLDVPTIHSGPILAVPTITQSVSPGYDRDRLSSGSITPTPSAVSNPYQQLLNIPIRGGRAVSAITQKRHDQSLENGYTVACGVVCPEVAPPVQKFNQGGGDFYCPRCLSNYTRPKSVKDHFPGCVSKYGNPLGLRYTDHESMPSKEAASQSRESSTISDGQVDDMTDVGDQEIKTEFVYGAE